MLNRRYPHLAAGRFAAPVFGLAGLIAGVVTALRIPNAPPLIINMALWAAISAAVAYLVFASEGPQQRPTTTTQASIADGVVAGIISAVTLILLDMFAAGGAGTSSGEAVTASRVATGFGGGMLFGAVAGAALGYVIYRAAGQERMERRPAPAQRRDRNSKAGARRTKSGKARQRR